MMINIWKSKIKKTKRKGKKRNTVKKRKTENEVFFPPRVAVLWDEYAHKTLHWQVFWLYGSLNRCSFTRTSPSHLSNGYSCVCLKMEQNKNFNIIFVNILCAVLEGSHVKNEKKRRSKLFKSDRRRIMYANHFCTPVSLHLTMFAFEKVVHFYCQLKWIIGLLSIQCARTYVIQREHK